MKLLDGWSDWFKILYDTLPTMPVIVNIVIALPKIPQGCAPQADKVPM